MDRREAEIGLKEPGPWAAHLSDRRILSQPIGPPVLPSLQTYPRDLEILESRFLDKEDWGTQQTLKEINHLQNACMR